MGISSMRLTKLLKKLPFLVLVSVSYFCNAQSAVPCPTTCGACAGGMISVTLRFNGTTTSLVTVEDNKNVIFSQQVAPNENIVLEPHGKNNFVGNTLEVKVKDVLNTTLNTK